MADMAALARQLERLYPRRWPSVELWPTPAILNEPLTAHGRKSSPQRRQAVVLPRGAAAALAGVGKSTVARIQRSTVATAVGAGTLAAEVRVVDLRHVYWHPSGGGLKPWDVQVVGHFGGRYRTAEEAVTVAQALRDQLGVQSKPRRRPKNAGGLSWIPPGYGHKARWRASITVRDDNGKPRRITRHAATHEAAEQLLAEMLAEKDSADRLA